MTNEINPEFQRWLTNMITSLLDGDGQIDPRWVTRAWLTEKILPDVHKDRASAARIVNQYCAELGRTFPAEQVIADWLEEISGATKSGRMPNKIALKQALVYQTGMTRKHAGIEIDHWLTETQRETANRSFSPWLMLLGISLYFIGSNGGMVDFGARHFNFRFIVTISGCVLWFTGSLLQSRNLVTLNENKGRHNLLGWELGRAIMLIVSFIIIFLSINELLPQSHLVEIAFLISAGSLLPLIWDIQLTGLAIYTLRKPELRQGHAVRPSLFLGYALFFAGMTLAIVGWNHPDEFWRMIGCVILIANTIYQVAHGSGLNDKDASGETLLTRAAKAGDTETARRLLAAGANPALRNGWRERAQDLLARV
jgi:hypothetical protein